MNRFTAMFNKFFFKGLIGKKMFKIIHTVFNNFFFKGLIGEMCFKLTDRKIRMEIKAFWRLLKKKRRGAKNIIFCVVMLLYFI